MSVYQYCTYHDARTSFTLVVLSILFNDTDGYAILQEAECEYNSETAVIAKLESQVRALQARVAELEAEKEK